MAQLVIAALSKILDDETFAQVHDSLNDSGVYDQLNKYKNAFDGEWFPVGTNSSTKFKIWNLENELIKLRTLLHHQGIRKRERALLDFEVGKNEKGHSILIPTTKLAELMIQNTKDFHFKLNSVPDEKFELVNRELQDAKENIAQLRKINDEINTSSKILECKIDQLRSQINFLNNSNSELSSQVSELEDHIEYQDKLIDGLAARSGLIIDRVDNSEFVQIGSNLSNKPIPVEIDSFPITFGDVDMREIESSFVKDLTNEGIEPNPGPARLALLTLLLPNVLGYKMMRYNEIAKESYNSVYYWDSCELKSNIQPHNIHIMPDHGKCQFVDINGKEYPFKLINPEFEAEPVYIKCSHTSYTCLFWKAQKNDLIHSHPKFQVTEIKEDVEFTDFHPDEETVYRFNWNTCYVEDDISIENERAIHEFTTNRGSVAQHCIMSKNRNIVQATFELNEFHPNDNVYEYFASDPTFMPSTLNCKESEIVFVCTSWKKVIEKFKLIRTNK